MHKECAIAVAAEHTALLAANAALPPIILLTGDEEDESLYG
jgi:hypothetical protein